jgi:hypothetical protein
VVLLLLYWKEWCILFTDGFNKASDPNELNDINGVMKLILFLYASLSSCKGTANLFDVVLKATLFLNLLF